MCGDACTGFDSPNGPSELIQAGVDGILMPAGQVALAEAILRLDEDLRLRQKLGGASRGV
jgi:glycosyltransferase involved in cell wall biosynthesis